MLVSTYVLGIALFHLGTILATLRSRIDDAANEIVPHALRGDDHGEERQP